MIFLKILELLQLKFRISLETHSEYPEWSSLQKWSTVLNSQPFLQIALLKPFLLKTFVSLNSSFLANSFSAFVVLAGLRYARFKDLDMLHLQH